MTSGELAEIHAAAFSPLRGWSKDEFEQLLLDPHTILTTHQRAFVLGRLIDDEAEILTLACHPSQQNQGFAGAALNDFHTTVAKKGATRVFLEVAEDNLAARALYRAYSYENTGLRRGYYARNGANVAALVLSRPL